MDKCQARPVTIRGTDLLQAGLLEPRAFYVVLTYLETGPYTQIMHFKCLEKNF